MAVPLVKFGYLPDPVDRRDRTFSSLLRARPLRGIEEKVDFRLKVPGILDQLLLASCVSQAISGAIRLKHVLNGINKPKLCARLPIYWGARGYIGTTEWDSGSHIRDGFRFTNAAGFLPEEETVHGYDISKFREAPTPLEQRLMFDQKNSDQGDVSYYRIFESGEARKQAIQLALSNEVIPVLGTETTDAFLQYRSGVLQKPSVFDRRTGGHAVYLCGYDADSVYVPNSWGKDVGEQGFMRLSWDYIMWEETRDIWGVAEAPYYSHLVNHHRTLTTGTS